MALRTLITERQRRIGAELRSLRERAGLSLAEAGALVDMGAPQLSHIEAGRTPMSAERLRVFAAGCGCKDVPLMEALITMGASSGRGWWRTYKDRVPQSSLDLAELESAASSVENYEILYIPGLLQSPEYTRSIFESSDAGLTSEEIDTAISFRRDRQAILAGDNAAEFDFIIHESALHMRFAGSEAMRAQLVHLLEISSLPNVTIRVYPFAVEKFPAYSAPFLAANPGVASLSTVMLDQPGGGTVFAGDQESLASFRLTFDRLARLALPPVNVDNSPRVHASRDSWGLIQHLLYQL